MREVNASPGPRCGQGPVTMLVGQLTAARTATKKDRRHARAARLSEVAAPAISLAFSRLLSPSCVPPLSCTEREKKLCEDPSLFLPFSRLSPHVAVQGMRGGEGGCTVNVHS